MSAIELLEKAAGHLKDRAATYDKPEGERSIGAAVKAFNAVTGDGLMDSEERGWLFMAILKMVRSQQGGYRADNYEDGAAYFALMGEAACEERNGGWTPQEIEAAAFKDACDSAEVELPEVELEIGVIGKDGNLNYRLPNRNNSTARSEYTLQEVIGDAVLSDWARWVAVDKNGDVWEYDAKPSVNYIKTEWIIPAGSLYRINQVVPPLNFKNCIFEVKR